MAQQPRFFNVGQAAQPLPAGAAAYGTTTAAGSIPIGLSMPGTAGLSLSQLAGQNNVMNTSQTFPLLTTQGTNQYTNTNQTSSNNQPFFLLNPAFYESVPSNVASTVGGLANFLITPPGYTQGGAPSAGGQFPYNYPITQTDINRIISGNEPRALAKHAEPIQPALLPLACWAAHSR